MKLGVNLSFAVKRWPEPTEWARIVREDLGLELVQFTLDLIDPWWPEALRRSLTRQVRQASEEWGIQIGGAFSGLANYCFNDLLHPDPAGRAASLEWWRRAADVTAEIGSSVLGGPLGGMSVRDASDPARRERLYDELLDSVARISEYAGAARLDHIEVEITPLTREVPSTVDQSLKLLSDLDGRCRVPVRLLVDVGHALYQPLYGRQVTLESWLAGLGTSIGAFHLQNTDFQSDSHWGWPDGRGRFDVAAFGRQVAAAALGDVPCYLEVIYPFEEADEDVLASIRSSVVHCRQQLSESAG